jgi:glycosyltransferase involved in cell wall biosynthesis
MVTTKYLELPLVSMITAVRNGEATLAKTIEAIVNQTYPRIEYIIIDANSTDGTAEIISKYRDRIDYYISEPDRGIADGWNKGLAVAKGDIISILNAGDYFDSEYIDKMVKMMPIDRELVCYGNTIHVDLSGQEMSYTRGKFHPPFYGGIGFFHPGVFVTRRTYERIGNFKLVYKLAMDCDWLFRCYRAGVDFQKVELVTMMLGGGVSETRKFMGWGEYWQAMKDNQFHDRDIFLSMLYFALRGSIENKNFCNFDRGS